MTAGHGCCDVFCHAVPEKNDFWLEQEVTFVHLRSIHTIPLSQPRLSSLLDARKLLMPSASRGGGFHAFLDSEPVSCWMTQLFQPQGAPGAIKDVQGRHRSSLKRIKPVWVDRHTDTHGPQSLRMAAETNTGSTARWCRGLHLETSRCVNTYFLFFFLWF